MSLFPIERRKLLTFRHGSLISHGNRFALVDIRPDHIVLMQLLPDESESEAVAEYKRRKTRRKVDARRASR